MAGAVQGDARTVDDLDGRQAILNELRARYGTPDHKREPVSRERAEKCGAVEIVVTRMAGRKVHAKEKVAWGWEAP
ncbi:MAG: hypothetical protein FJX75_10025 [Armatimonadetes bacterium]|nr:hypothetical protein [Armatimonadota bacterium]